jgi:phosphohistidine phosphatase SixA
MQTSLVIVFTTILILLAAAAAAAATSIMSRRVISESRVTTTSTKLYDTTIVCIRHAESQANLILHANKHLQDKHDDATSSLLSAAAGNDAPLTPLGHNQARATEQHLRRALTKADDDSLQVFCSPLLRARETLAAFQRDATMPLSIKKVETLTDMAEYDTQVHGSAEAFVEQIFRLFGFLRRKCESAVAEPRTIVLFGHSLAFSTLLYIVATARPGLSDSDHYRFVLDRLCNKDRPAYLNTVYHLPNCSVSVARVSHPSRNNNVAEWSILGVGKDDHLRALGVNTGNQCDF